MKLRLRGQSLRLRLSQPDVAALRDDGQLDDSLVFGPLPEQRLAYGIVLDPAAEAIGVRYDPGRLTVVLPRALAVDWTVSTEVTLAGRQAVPAAGDIKVSIEKDFACGQVRPAEEDAGAYEPMPSGPVC